MKEKFIKDLVLGTNCWGSFEKFVLFTSIGVHYTSGVILGSHPLVSFLDPESQFDYFKNNASMDQRKKNQKALAVNTKGVVRKPITYIIDIDDRLGFGLFSSEEISRGDYIGEYTGLLEWKGHHPIFTIRGLLKGIPKTDYDMTYLMDGYSPRLSQALIRENLDFLTRFPEPAALTVEASYVGNEARFINHMGNDEGYCLPNNQFVQGPNVEVVKGFNDGFFRQWLFAKRDIKPGEELRMDYGKSYWQRKIPVSKFFFAHDGKLFELANT